MYITALGFAAYRIYISITERRIIAEREFYDLADLSAAAGVLGFMDADFQEAIRDGLNRSLTLQALIISGPNGEYAFERERASAVSWVGDAPRFIKRFGLSADPFFTPIMINGLRNVTISAVFRTINYDDVIDILRRTLLVILAGLVVAFIAFVIESLVLKNQTEAPLPAGNARRPPKKAVRRPPEDAGEYGTYDAAELAPAEQDPFEQDPLEQAPFDADSMDFDIPEEDLDGIDFPEDTGAEAEASGGFTPALEGDAPQGLYSPRSNVGWEDYTLDRLDAELHRCASFEQDLVLLTLEFRNTDNADELYRELADAAVDFFNLRDLIFEKGERGLVVIVPNIDLDQGFSKAGEFHSRLPPAITGATELNIGLSSRAGRLVNAERLLFEASEALTRAVRDPASPIIAFKSDPEKYRAFIRSRHD